MHLACQGVLQIFRGLSMPQCLQDGWPHTWLEVKNELGDGGADPLAESLLYHYHYLRSKNLQGKMMPGLILELAGASCR